MTKTVSLSENVSLQTVIALTRNGDEVVIEENGAPLARVTPVAKPQEQKPRIAGLGKGTIWVSEDFADEWPDELGALTKNYEPVT